VLLTSHYMEDVVALCPRVVVIDKGHLLHDGDLKALIHQVRPDKRIVVRFASGAAPGAAALVPFGQVVSADPAQATLQVAADQVAAAVSRLLAALPVTDLTVEDPPLEEVMKELFDRSREARRIDAAAQATSASAPTRP
jgi:ABC-2 type transport system ATP-binding protein